MADVRNIEGCAFWQRGGHYGVAAREQHGTYVNFGRVYTLGNPIEIVVNNVDVDAHQIDFLPYIPRLND